MESVVNPYFVKQVLHTLGAALQGLVVPKFVCALASDKAACDLAKRWTGSTELRYFEFADGREVAARFEGDARMDMMVLIYSCPGVHSIRFAGEHRLPPVYALKPPLRWQWTVGINTKMHTKSFMDMHGATRSLAAMFSGDNMTKQYLERKRPWGPITKPEQSEVETGSKRFQDLFRSSVVMPVYTTSTAGK